MTQLTGLTIINKWTMRKTRAIYIYYLFVHFNFELHKRLAGIPLK